METLVSHRVTESQSHKVIEFRHPTTCWQASRFYYFAILLFLLISPVLHSQNYPALQEAFGKSYDYEAKGNYTEAISALKNVYQEDSYEINLRLGWETYLAGLFTESSAYYEKAINHKPYAI